MQRLRFALGTLALLSAGTLCAQQPPHKPSQEAEKARRVATGFLSGLAGSTPKKQPNIVFVVNGLIDPTFTLDANGEGSLTVPVPPWLPLGLPITLQGLAVNPANLAIGFTFANPMTIVFN